MSSDNRKRKKKTPEIVPEVCEVIVETHEEEREVVVIEEEEVKKKPPRRATTAAGSMQKQEMIRVKEAFITAIIHLMLQTKARHTSPSEMEIRIGRYNAAKNIFQTGVDETFLEEAFQQIYTQYLNKGGVAISDNWILERVDYYNRGKGANIRVFHPTSTDEKFRYELNTRMMTQDFVQQGLTTDLLYDVRCSLKSEIQLCHQDVMTMYHFIPEDTKPNSIRLKWRKSLEFVSSGFKIEFTKAIQVKSEAQLEKAIPNSFEIEIESLDNASASNLCAAIMGVLGYDKLGLCNLMPVQQQQIPENGRSKKK